MQWPLDVADFAATTRVPAEDLERYRKLGLLDPDKDGLFDEYDTLRLFWVQLETGRGTTPEQMARAIEDGTVPIPYFGDLLYPKGDLVEAADFAPQIGLTPEQLDAVGIATGLPLKRALDAADVEALSPVGAMVGAGFPLEAMLDFCRVLGDAFRRIAQTEVRLMHEHVHEPLARQGVPEHEINLRESAIIETMAPIMEPVLGFIHKQFLMRAVIEEILLHREEDAIVDRRGYVDATILFVDLSSFTSLAAVHGDTVAADIVKRFDAIVRAHVLEHKGMLVKQIGDEFMLTFRDPADAVRFALVLSATAGAEEGFPALRIGIHSGPVLYRVGDYIGNTVNVASRVAGSAAAGEIVMTEPVADVAKAAGAVVEPAGVRILRGFEDPIALFRVVRDTALPMRDPVCGMMVLEPVARFTRKGAEHAFCSEDCLRKFVDAPERYETTAAHTPSV